MNCLNLVRFSKPLHSNTMNIITIHKIIPGRHPLFYTDKKISIAEFSNFTESYFWTWQILTSKTFTVMSNSNTPNASVQAPALIDSFQPTVRVMRL